MALFLSFFFLGRNHAKFAQKKILQRLIGAPTESPALEQDYSSSERQWRKPRLWFLGIFLTLSAISIFFASYKFLALYSFIRLVLLILTALAIAEILKRNWIKLENILALLAGLAVFQSLVAFFQFLNQKNLGFWFLGESVLGPEIPGVAKIIVAGGRILRSYGAFPHPNVLAAFLLLGLFSSYHFLFRSRATRNNDKAAKFRFVNVSCLIPILAVFFINLGLVLTFSRAAWFLGIFLTLFYVSIFRNYVAKDPAGLDMNYRRQAKYLLIILAFIFFFIVLTMGWLIFPRAQISLAEPAASQRIAYNEIGWQLIKNNPGGVGLGNQAIYSAENGLYQIMGMNQAWQWQPIHNIYFLIGAEIGGFGLAIFLIFIAMPVINTAIFLLKNKNPENSLSLVVGLMFLSLLGFGLFDHFLWTLHPGRLMFWLILGIILGISPRRSMDRTQASEV